MSVCVCCSQCLCGEVPAGEIPSGVSGAQWEVSETIVSLDCVSVFGWWLFFYNNNLTCLAAVVMLFTFKQKMFFFRNMLFRISHFQWLVFAFIKVHPRPETLREWDKISNPYFCSHVFSVFETQHWKAFISSAWRKWICSPSEIDLLSFLYDQGEKKTLNLVICEKDTI